MNCNRVLAASLLTCALALGTGILPVLNSFAYADEEKKSDNKNTIRNDMGKHLAPAQDLIKQKKFSQALAEIQQADDMADKTPYEKYVIAALREQVYASQNDAPNTAKAAQALIETGFLQPADVAKQEGIIARVYFGAKDYPKAIDYANRYYKDGGTDDTYHQIIINSMYLSGNYADATKALRAYIAGEERAGEKPTEEQLSNLMGFEYKVDPGGAGYIDALSRLVQLYPKKDYWHDLIISIEKRPGITDEIRLDIDQIKLLTGFFDSAQDYMDAAQSALEAGLPGNAKMFVDKGYADGKLGQGADASRHKRLSDMATQQSAQDQNVLAQEAASAKTGTLLYKLGNAYLSYGQYDKAVAAYDKATQNGNFKTPIEAGLNKVHEGVAYLKLNQKPKAAAAFSSVTSPEAVANVGKLWALYGGVK